MHLHFFDFHFLNTLLHSTVQNNMYTSIWVTMLHKDMTNISLQGFKMLHWKKIVLLLELVSIA